MAFKDVIKAGLKSMADSAMDNFYNGVKSYTENEINETIDPFINTTSIIISDLLQLTNKCNKENRIKKFYDYMTVAKLYSYILPMDYNTLVENQEKEKDLFVKLNYTKSPLLIDEWNNINSQYESAKVLLFGWAQALAVYEEFAEDSVLQQIINIRELCTTFKNKYDEAWSIKGLFKKRRQKKMIREQAELLIFILPTMLEVFEGIKKAPGEILDKLYNFLN